MNNCKTPSSGAEEILTAAPTPLCHPLDEGPDQGIIPVHCSCNGATNSVPGSQYDQSAQTPFTLQGKGDGFSMT